MTPVQSRRLTQEIDDTYQRGLVGGIFYLVGWLVVGFYGDAFVRAPLASWAVVSAFIALTILRVVHRPPRPEVDARRRLGWLYQHWAIILATTALWGGVFCWAMLDPGFGRAQPAALLSTLGLATAAAHVFCMRRGAAFASLALLYLPGLVVLLGIPAHRPSALVMSVYLLYVVVALLRSHAEYHKRLDLDQDLRDQRDLFAQRSLIDPLTELANRRHFADVLATASVHAARTGAPLTLLLLDLDHFKAVNDSHGHAAGDACLVAFARRLKDAFTGAGEPIARVGGEEFGVVCDGQLMSAVCARAQFFRDSLVEDPITVDVAGDAIVLGITASIGIAEFDRAWHRTADDLYRAADSAVYRAKAEGRNRVCRDEPAAAYQAG